MQISITAAVTAESKYSPGAKQANPRHYSSRDPGGITGGAKSVDGNYGKQGGAGTDKDVCSQPGGLTGSLALVTDNRSQCCRQQEAQNHFYLNWHPVTPVKNLPRPSLSR